MDFKNINTILYKFSSQFKMGNPSIVNSVVLNLDYLLVNFPYFKDIEVVLDFLLSNNKELRFVLRDQVPMILRILKYKKEYNKYECGGGKGEGGSKSIGLESPSNPLSTLNLHYHISNPSTPKPFTPTSPHSSNTPTSPQSSHTPPTHTPPSYTKPPTIPLFLNNISKNKVFLWKKSLKGLTLKKFYNSWLNEENDIIFNLNEEMVVYDGVFKILSFHFDLLRDFLIDFDFIYKLLEFIELESAQELLRKLLDKRFNNNLYLILKILEENEIYKKLIKIGCYYEIELIVNKNENEDINIWDIIYELRNNLLEKFLIEKKFYKWISICRILEKMYKMKRNGEIKIIKGMYECEGGGECGGRVEGECGGMIEDGSKVEGECGGMIEGDGRVENEDSEGRLEDSEGRLEDDEEYKMKSIANGDIEQKLTNLDINAQGIENPFTTSSNQDTIPSTTQDTTPSTLPTLLPHTPTPLPTLNLKSKFYTRLLCIPLDFSLPLIFNSNLYLKFIGFFLDNPDDSFYSNSLFDFFKMSLKIPKYKNLLEKAGFIKGIEKIFLRNLSELYGGRPKIEVSFIFCIYLLKEIEDYVYYDLINLIIEGDLLKYNDDLKIDDHLNNFLNDIIIRFTCNLVIDRMPVLSAFLSKEGHPESKVEFAESKEEKRVRLGGGMQDTM